MLNRSKLIAALLGLLAPWPVAAGALERPDATLRECPALSWEPPSDAGPVVANPAELQDALARVKQGGTILLAGGNFGRFSLSGYNPSSEVTLGAADPGDPPVFNNLALEDASNLRLAGLRFEIDGSKPFDINHLDRALDIVDSQHITVLNSLFVGHAEEPQAAYVIRDPIRPSEKATIDFSGLGRGLGMAANRSDHIQVLGSTFSDLTVGSNFNRASDLKFIGNTYTGIAFDSTDWGGVSDLEFRGNLIANNPVPQGLQHADLMQFRFAASRNVTIRDNVLISAAPISHGIYMGRAPKDEYRYSNIVIADNVVLASQLLALSVLRADGLKITGNRVLSNAAAGRAPAAILVEDSSTDVEISNNVANTIRAASDSNWDKRPMPGDWIVNGNRIVRGPDTPPAITQAPACDG